MPTYGEVLGAWKSRWEIDIVQDKECGTFGFMSTCGSGGIGCMEKTREIGTLRRGWAWGEGQFVLVYLTLRFTPVYGSAVKRHSLFVAVPFEGTGL